MGYVYVGGILGGHAWVGANAAASALAAISLVWLKRYTIRELSSLEVLKREMGELTS